MTTEREKAEALETRLAAQRRGAAERASRTRAVVAVAGASPPARQVAFLKGLLADPAAAKAFLEAPESFAAERGIVVEPELIRGMVDTLVFEEPMSERLVARLGPDVTAELVDLQGGGRVAALPIAVATAVAVASAAVALVAQASSSRTLSDLRGLKQGVAGGLAVVASNSAILAYAVSTVTASAVASAAGTSLAGRASLPTRR